MRAGRHYILELDSAPRFVGDRRGPVHLKIGIPARKLLHLTVSADALAKVTGAFAGAEAARRKAVIQAISGLVEIEDLESAETTASNMGGVVRMKNPTGAVDVPFSLGELVIENLRGDAKVRLVEGPITIVGITGDATAEVTKGDIRIENARGVVVANTTLGNVYLNNPIAKSERGHTITGRVHNTDGTTCDGILGATVPTFPRRI